MEYRKLPHGNEMIGTLGLGTGGHCGKRCPFKVKQQNKMQRVAEYFGGRN